MKVFKGTGMVRILTCAAQKLHSETKTPFGLSKEPMHLLTCRKQKKEEKHGICQLIIMIFSFNWNSFNLVFCK